jgi:hypothetical protein
MANANIANIIIKNNNIHVVADKEVVEKLVTELRKLGLSIKIVYQVPCG